MYRWKINFCSNNEGISFISEILVEGTQEFQLRCSTLSEENSTPNSSRTLIPETQAEDIELAAAEALAVVSAVLPPEDVAAALAASGLSGESFLTPGQVSPIQKTKQTKLHMKKVSGTYSLPLIFTISST